MDLIRARGRGVPRGGTAKFRLCRLRVYTVLAFCFSAGKSESVLRTPACAQLPATIIELCFGSTTKTDC